MALGFDAGYLVRAIRATGAHVGVESVSVLAASWREPAENRSLRNRDVEKAHLSCGGAGNDGPGIAIRLPASQSGWGGRKGFYRPHDRNIVSYAEQSFLTHWIVAGLGSAGICNHAKRAVFYGGHFVDVVGGATIAQDIVPFSLAGRPADLI